MLFNSLLCGFLVVMKVIMTKQYFKELKDEYEDILLYEKIKDNKLQNLVTSKDICHLRNLKTPKKHKVIRKAYLNEDEDDAMWTEYSECGDSCIEILCPITNE